MSKKEHSIVSAAIAAVKYFLGEDLPTKGHTPQGPCPHKGVDPVF